MFTGIVAAQCQVLAVNKTGAGLRLKLALGSLIDGLAIGASVAVNGVCLTVAAITDSTAEFDIIPETLKLTTLGALNASDSVNCERAACFGDEIGGHFVLGHVDTAGEVTAFDQEGEGTTLRISYPPNFANLVVPKGSIVIDGVSLTLVDVNPDSFSVCLIPETLATTGLGSVTVGTKVNLEFDYFAKLIAKQMEALCLKA